MGDMLKANSISLLQNKVPKVQVSPLIHRDQNDTTSDARSANADKQKINMEKFSDQVLFFKYKIQIYKSNLNILLI